MSAYYDLRRDLVLRGCDGIDQALDEARAKALDAEAVRERDWSDLEATVRDFAKQYGIGALLRCVGRAVEDQKELPL